MREIDETGYPPLRPRAGAPPAPGFRLVQRDDVNGLILYRFVSPVPRVVSEVALRTHVITPHAHPEVLVPGAAARGRRAVAAATRRTRAAHRARGRSLRRVARQRDITAPRAPVSERI